jgi:hypothetical protein
MVFRRDLIEHFQWLEGSEYYDEVLDEALVAIAMHAYGHMGDMLCSGTGAWQSVDWVVQYFELWDFVAQVRAERICG